MKKVMFGLAAAAAIAAFGIESANTVGYTTKDIAQGAYVLTAVQFETVDQQNNITNLVKTSDAGTTA